MSKPERWLDPANKLFRHTVGFTGPPMDFDAAPTDFLRISPESVGVHGRLLHAPGYEHELSQRADNFQLLDEVVHCFSNAGADVVGQAAARRGFRPLLAATTGWAATDRVDDDLHAGRRTPNRL